MTPLNNSISPDAFQVPEIIPIFPLPNVVFFPDTYLPLYIFEPRYRQMVAESSQNGLYIGMALLKEEWKEDYYGNPSIHSVGCAGKIKNIEPLPDGCYNIILQGLCRFEIEEELFACSYRKAKISRRLETEFQSLEDSSLRSKITKLAIEYLRSTTLENFCKLIKQEALSDSVLVNSLSSCLDFSSFEKLFLLESETLVQQARRLSDLLQFKLHEQNQLQRGQS